MGKDMHEGSADGRVGTGWRDRNGLAVAETL